MDEYNGIDSQDDDYPKSGSKANTFDSYEKFFLVLLIVGSITGVGCFVASLVMWFM